MLTIIDIKSVIFLAKFKLPFDFETFHPLSAIYIVIVVETPTEDIENKKTNNGKVSW